MEYHFWIDESGTPNLKGDEEHFTVGMLYGPQRITVEYIATYWAEFLRDPEIKGNRKDAASIKRGFFHASEDSKNAHSHCCRAAQNLKEFEFGYMGFEKEKAHSDTDWLTANESRFHQHLIKLIATSITKIPAQKFIFHIAQRAKSFPKDAGDRWGEEFLKKRLWSACTLPQIAMPFPHIVVEMVEGREPGVQIADFLLWAAMRKRFIGDATWIDRSSFRQSHSVTIEGDPLMWNHFENGYTFKTNPNIPPLENMRIPDERQTLDRCIGLIFLAERQLRSFKQNPIEHARHWLSEVLVPLECLDTRTGDTLDVLQKLAKAYIYLVDTVPFYDPACREEVHAVIDTKYWMEKFIYKPNHLHVLNVIDHWMYNRKTFLEKSPEILGLSSRTLSMCKE